MTGLIQVLSHISKSRDLVFSFDFSDLSNKD